VASAHGDDSGFLHEDPVREISSQDGAVVVRLCGELDVYNAKVVREALAGAADGEPDRMILDLDEVTFVDSTLLGVLVEARMRLADQRGFLLAAPGLEVRRALEISGLVRHFEVHETVDSALAAKLATPE
jgi:anti-sigma B factor antagonist